MVKGISRQVILVQSPDTQLFEQAIFILKEGARPVTDEMLLREAKGLISCTKRVKKCAGPIWACCGAAITGVVWLFTIFL